MTLLSEIEEAFKHAQDTICDFFVKETGQTFIEDNWQHKEQGGGRTRIFQGNNQSDLIEKGGVNYSSIGGSSLPPAALAQLHLKGENLSFRGTGLSLVIHPQSPAIPTIHLNVRYFEAGEDVWWFGGGVDLTPYYPNFNQIVAFHQKLSDICEDAFGKGSYQEFKKRCDEYFFIKHRGEARGVGGLFFDHLNSKSYPEHTKTSIFRFVVLLAETFVPLFAPFLQNRNIPYDLKQKEFQLIRRSRYVEFNLLYDRGTLFGLQSQGRIESILMSLPPYASWKYNWKPEENSVEERVLRFYLKPQPWLSLSSEESLFASASARE